MPSASDPRQPNRTRQPAPRPVPSGQRPVQPAQRAAQPAARPAQPSSRPAQPAQRPGQQPASRPAQQPAARAAQPACGARFKQQAPTQRAQAPQSYAHHAHGTHGVAPAARSSYNTRRPKEKLAGAYDYRRRGCGHRSRCYRHLRRAGRQGLAWRGGRERYRWPAGYRYDSRWRLGRHDRLDSLREPYCRESQGLLRGGQKAQCGHVASTRHVLVHDAYGCDQGRSATY